MFVSANRINVERQIAVLRHFCGKIATTLIVTAIATAAPCERYWFHANARFVPRKMNWRNVSIRQSQRKSKLWLHQPILFPTRRSE